MSRLRKHRPKRGDGEMPSAARLWLCLWKQMSGEEHRNLKIAAIVMVAGSALTAVLPILIGNLVDQAGPGVGIEFPDSALRLGMIAGLVIVVQMLQVIRRQLVEGVATGFERDSRNRAYRHLLRLNLDDLAEREDGSVYGRANRSIEGAVKLVKLGAMDLLPALTLAALALIVAFAHGPAVALAMLPVVPTGFALVYFQVRSQAGVRVEIQDHKEGIDGKVAGLLPALDVVRSSGAEAHFGDRIREACAALRTTELRHHKAMSLFDAFKAINEGLWLLVTLAVAVEVAATGQTVGDLTAYVLLYVGVTNPLRELHRIVDEATESAQQTRSLFDLLDESEDESYEPSPVQVGTGGAIGLTMSSVHFHHRGRPQPALDDVCIEIAPGERVGLVGPTGCGKSTLLKIVARLHHGYAGSIRLGETDLRSIGREELNNLVGFVPQQPKLFRGTIWENITLGRNDTTVGEVVRAAERANIAADILRLPDGYETVIVERGESLSGGQQQRLCLARALLRTPPLLLLDEPTAALDGESQRAVQLAIDGMSDVSLIHVSHRVETLRTMDRIVVMQAGRIVKEDSFGALSAEDWFNPSTDPAGVRA